MRNKNYEFRVLKNGIKNTSEADIGRDIFYKCLICETMIKSTTRDNVACDCVNIYIDADMHRLCVEDLTKIQVLEKVKKERNI